MDAAGGDYHNFLLLECRRGSVLVASVCPSVCILRSRGFMVPSYQGPLFIHGP